MQRDPVRFLLLTVPKALGSVRQTRLCSPDPKRSKKRACFAPACISDTYVQSSLKKHYRAAWLILPNCLTHTHAFFIKMRTRQTPVYERESKYMELPAFAGLVYDVLCYCSTEGWPTGCCCCCCFGFLKATLVREY